MGKWENAVSYGSKTFITHIVAGEEVKFWPVSVKLLLQLKDFVGPLSQSISILTADNRTDTAHKFREAGDPVFDHEGKVMFHKDGRPVRDSEQINEAVDPKLAQMREQQRTKAIKDLMDAVFDESNLHTVSAIIIDSVKRGDYFDEVPTAAKFAEKLTPELLMQFVIGVGKANKGVFGPLAGRFEGIQDALKRRVSLEPKKNPTHPASGETSEIKLSGSSSEDSMPDG